MPILREGFCCFKICLHGFSACTTQAGELGFGEHQILSIAGAQQGDPLSRLLFLLVILELLDFVGTISGLHLQLWFLDEGFFTGHRRSISSLLHSLLENGPKFGLHVQTWKK